MKTTGLVAYVTRPSQIIGDPKAYQAVLSSTVLGKCIKSHLWENSVFVSKQLKGIGPAFSTLLAAAGKVNFMLLEESHPRDLERVMNKSPPAGNILRKQISLLPKYQLTVTAVDENSIKIQLKLLNQTYLAENMENLTAGVNHKCYIIVGDTVNCLLLLTSFMDKDLIGIYDGQITLDIKRKHNFEHKITAHCISSHFVGIDVHCEHEFRNLDGSCKNPKPISPEDIKAKVKHVRQAAITDTFKIRKRKNYDANETLVEKKKCEHTIIEKIEPTNELYANKRSLNDETDFYKNIQKQQENILTQRVVKLDEDTKYQYIENFEQGDDEYDKENYDEATVNCILNEIENEIHCQEKLKLRENSEKTKPKIQHKNIINSFYELSKKYRNSEKSNYSFLNKIDKKTNINDEQSKNDSKNTFTDSVKTYIDMFLEKTKQRSKIVDSNLINLVEINEPGCVSQTTDLNVGTNNEIIEENENNASFTASENYHNEKRFKEDSNVTDLIKINDRIDKINNIVDSTVEIYKTNGNNHIEANILDGLYKNQKETTELDMSLKNKIDNINLRLVCNNARSDNYTNILNNNYIFNRDDKNKCFILSEDIIISGNQNNDLNKAVPLIKPSSRKIINIQNTQKISNNDNPTNNQTESHNSINSVQQKYITNDIESIFKDPIFHDNRINCNINQITYTMSFPLTKTLSETEHTEKNYPLQTRNTSNITIASDKVESITENQYKNHVDPNKTNCLTEIHPNNSNKIESTSDEIEKNNKNKHLYTSPSCSNFLALTQNDNSSNVIDNPFSNITQDEYGLDSRLTAAKSNHLNLSNKNNKSADINCMKTITFTKTQVNVYAKNTLERNYCVMSQFKFDLDIAESNVKLKDGGESLKHEQNKYEDIRYNKLESIQPKYQSLINSQPSIDVANNSNVVMELETVENSKCHTSTEVKNDFKQDDSRDKKYRNLHDIIEKYKNIMSSKHNVLTPNVYKNQSGTASRQCEKINRPFKITDLPSLHEPNIEFQNGQYGTQKPIYFSHETRKGIIHGTGVMNNTYDLGTESFNRENNNMNTELKTEETELNTIDISESMFNPKTVLECFKGDIIPPPSEFRDKGISDDQNKIDELEASSSNIDQITQPNEYEFENVLEGKYRSAGLSKQTETWKLSASDDGYKDPYKSFNIIRNKSCTSFRSQITRKSKLNEFKFSPKSTFKNRRK